MVTPYCAKTNHPIYMTTSTIHWPALIQHLGDAELALLNDAEAFATWPVPTTSTRLIDATGQILIPSPDKHLTVHGQATLSEILTLIRQHALLEGVCCTSKLGAASIAEAFAILASLIKD